MHSSSRYGCAALSSNQRQVVKLKQTRCWLAALLVYVES